MIVYLGIAEDIFDVILSPVVNFLNTMVKSVLAPAINTLNKLLEPIQKAAIDLFLDIVSLLLGDVLYGILRSLLRILDFMENGYDYLLGINKVVYNNGGVLKSIPITDIVFESKPLRVAVIYITLMAIAVAAVFSIIAVIRAAGDLQDASLGKVLRRILRTTVTFVCMPMVILFMIKLSGIIMDRVKFAILPGETSLATTIFLVSGLNAANDAKYNKSPDFYDDLRRGYINSDKRPWSEITTVKSHFNIAKMDYLIGFTASISLIVILGLVLVVAVRRIFESALLYLVSPFFIGATPLDDGKLFQKWFEMFVGRLLMGLGSLAGIRIYLMVLPILMDSKRIDYTAGGYIGVEMSYVLRLLIVIGGAWSALKAGAMITSLIESSAGASEESVLDMGGALTMSAVSAGIGMGISKGINIATKGVPGMSNNEKGKNKAADESGNQSNSYSGGKTSGNYNIPGLERSSGGDK